jgi:hypothetical protein
MSPVMSPLVPVIVPVVVPVMPIVMKGIITITLSIRHRQLADVELDFSRNSSMRVLL